MGMNRKQIQRFIRLTYLIEPLQEMVDRRHDSEIKIAFNPAVELSFLTVDERYDLADAIVANHCTPSLAQCQEFKRLSHDGELTTEFIQETLEAEKPNQKEKLYLEICRKSINTFQRTSHQTGKRILSSTCLKTGPERNRGNRNDNRMSDIDICTCDFNRLNEGAVCFVTWQL